MDRIFILLISILLLNCGEKKRPILGENDFQKKLNSEFKDASTSPLKDRDRKIFEGLEFFPVDSTFVVDAILTPTPNSGWFKMKTTTERLSEERVYGIINFRINDQEYNLEVYQGKEMMAKEGFGDYLFLPFLDDTNGDETYGGGRYIDSRIPADSAMTIDFNTAYNPYCAYNEKYSCPIVPRSNYLPIKVKAGVKAFKRNIK